MNLQEVFYHGVRDQIRRVLAQMTDAEIDRGLTAFEDGQSNWSHCFFARACPDLDLNGFGNPEYKLVKHFGLPGPVPIRIVYQTFDGVGVSMKKEELAAFIRQVRLDDGSSVNPAINEILGKVQYDETKVAESCPRA